MYKFLASIIFVLYIFAIIYYRFKKPPRGVNGEMKDYYVDSSKIRFLYDLSWEENGDIKSEQKIFKAIREAIKAAHKIILFDVFLFNNQKTDPSRHIKITDIITDDLKNKKIPRYFITDPLNTSYCTDRSKSLAELARTGTKIIITDLDKLPDGNMLYSGFWRLFFQWFTTRGKGIIPNPMKEKRKTTIRALLKALNAKANHRKLLVADDVVIVSSSNLHNTSCFYSNTGLQVEDAGVARHFLLAEQAVARMSGCDVDLSFLETQRNKKNNEESKDVTVTPLMGKQTKKSIVQDLLSVCKGDRIAIGMLFIADREIINILKQKAKEAVDVTLVLDNNLISFHRKKIGLPNFYLGPELEKAGIKVYVFKDRENEYHSKFVYIRKKDRAIFHAGSANLTKRSLLEANLENNIRIESSPDKGVFKQIEKYIDRIKKEPYSERLSSRPKLYILGRVWVRIAERLGFASW